MSLIDRTEFERRKGLGKYKNFSAEEFACKFTRKFLFCDDLIQKLQEIREEIERPIKILSGYRDPSHPDEAKKEGHGLGPHTTGYAVDFRIQGGTSYDYGVAIRELQTIFSVDGRAGLGIRLAKSGAIRAVHFDFAESSPRWTSANLNLLPFRPALWGYKIA